MASRMLSTGLKLELSMRMTWAGWTLWTLAAVGTTISHSVRPSPFSAFLIRPLSNRLSCTRRPGGDGYAIPFDTQMLNDNDDDSPYFNEDEDEPEDIMRETQGQLKRVRPENINYAKRAKRVDVKKLKDSIWKELEEVTITVKEVRIRAFIYLSRALLLLPSPPCLPARFEC
jgi:hypothetical protein